MTIYFHIVISSRDDDADPSNSFFGKRVGCCCIFFFLLTVTILRWSQERSRNRVFEDSRMEMFENSKVRKVNLEVNLEARPERSNSTTHFNLLNYALQLVLNSQSVGTSTVRREFRYLVINGQTELDIVRLIIYAKSNLADSHDSQ
ncbi:hypothetical protein WN51_04116 [Melipona quadrifasciata]|uniref:Uncharacterized protein n=1 Tax=Melipona quadrifasciata TaxID=166423 RepID=A0A0M8ZPS5_9HYME|nr:hypothetical protein WN51_04116 [Melipona quadrifasciata]